jgi:hypothetical protein
VGTTSPPVQTRGIVDLHFTGKQRPPRRTVELSGASSRAPRQSDRITTISFQKWLISRPQDLFTVWQYDVLSRGAGRPSALARQPAAFDPPCVRIVRQVIIRIYISQPTGRDPDSLATARVSRAPTVQGRLGYLRVRVSRIRSGSYAVSVVARILRLPHGAARIYYIHRVVRFAPVKRPVGAPSCL